MGARMHRSGYRIVLDKQLQVKHLKEWRLISLIRTDILFRAIPWTKLILESQETVNDLNLHTSQRISAGLVGIAVMVSPLAFVEPLTPDQAAIIRQKNLEKHFINVGEITNEQIYTG